MGAQRYANRSLGQVEAAAPFASYHFTSTTGASIFSSRCLRKGQNPQINRAPLRGKKGRGQKGKGYYFLRLLIIKDGTPMHINNVILAGSGILATRKPMALLLPAGLAAIHDITSDRFMG